MPLAGKNQKCRRRKLDGPPPRLEDAAAALPEVVGSIDPTAEMAEQKEQPGMEIA